MDGFGRPDTFAALGIVRNGIITAGVVFNQHRPLLNIELTIASVGDKRWCNREVLWWIFAYPFLQLKCKRVTALVDSTNQPVQAFLCRVGFHQEGILRQGYPPNGDAVIFGMLKDECRWLENGRDVHRKAA